MTTPHDTSFLYGDPVKYRLKAVDANGKKPKGIDSLLQQAENILNNSMVKRFPEVKIPGPGPMSIDYYLRQVDETRGAPVGSPGVEGADFISAVNLLLELGYNVTIHPVYRAEALSAT